MSYTVELDPSGNRFTVADGQSVLDAAQRAGVLLPYGCRNGACGACRARVMAGIVDYPGPEPGDVLTAREVASGWALLCQARPASDLRLRAEELDGNRGLIVRTLPVRVAGVETLGHDVTALRLALPPSERLQFRAGQYVDILLRDGRRRAFSLANPPFDDRRLEFHVRRIPGGSFSDRILPGLEERALLRIRGPLGSFFLRSDRDVPVLFVAGGTGLAPIKSIIENAQHEGIAREMHLYWGVRSTRDLYLHDWARSLSDVRFTAVLSQPGPGAAEDRGAGRARTGLVHEAVLADFPDLSGLDVYASGPPVMVRAVRESFPQRGLSSERLFYDSFEYAYETGHDG